MFNITACHEYDKTGYDYSNYFFKPQVFMQLFKPTIMLICQRSNLTPVTPLLHAKYQPSGMAVCEGTNLPYLYTKELIMNDV